MGEVSSTERVPLEGDGWEPYAEVLCCFCGAKGTGWRKKITTRPSYSRWCLDVGWVQYAGGQGPACSEKHQQQYEEMMRVGEDVRDAAMLAYRTKALGLEEK